jgi:hypothetical protein
LVIPVTLYFLTTPLRSTRNVFSDQIFHEVLRRILIIHN